MPNENARTAQLIKVLNSIHDCRAKKRHGGKFQSGEPDVAGCFMGLSFFIEVKLDTGQLTQLQASELDKWREAGAITAVAIWRQADKQFRIVTLADSETWIQLAGPAKSLYDDSRGCPALRMKESEWLEWLKPYAEVSCR